MLYLFPAPFSYTGDDVAEIHLYTNRAVTEAIDGESIEPQAFEWLDPGSSRHGHI